MQEQDRTPAEPVALAHGMDVDPFSPWDSTADVAEEVAVSARRSTLLTDSLLSALGEVEAAWEAAHDDGAPPEQLAAAFERLNTAIDAASRELHLYHRGLSLIAAMSMVAAADSAHRHHRLAAAERDRVAS